MILKYKDPEYMSKLHSNSTNWIGLTCINILTNEKIKFISLKEATRQLNLERRAIIKNIYSNNSKPCNGIYNFFLDKPITTTKSIEIQPNSIPIEVTDLENKTTIIYDSISQASRKMGENQNSISYYLSKSRSKPFKLRYIINKVNIDSNLNSTPIKSITINNTVNLKNSYPIQITDLDTNITLKFDSIRHAVTYYPHLSQGSISDYLINNRSKPFKGRYIIKIIISSGK